MPTVLLVRHGRTSANTAGTLAGWTPGVGLDATGRSQAVALSTRVAGLPVRRLVSSPLQRCRQTAQILAEAVRRPVEPDRRLAEVRYGDWTGRALKDLARTRLWRTVQQQPSAVVFPGADGESMAAVQHRAVQAVRDNDRQVAEQHGDRALWIAVSHGDVIKAVLADALGMHLDQFQRIVVDPCSVSVVRYTATRPFVLGLNDTGGTLDGWRRRPRARGSDADVGGGAGGS